MHEFLRKCTVGGQQIKNDLIEKVGLTEDQAEQVRKYLIKGIDLTFNHPVNLTGAV